MCEEKCEEKLVDLLVKKMIEESVPLPIGHGVYFLQQLREKKIHPKYLEKYDVQSRALALIIFIGVSGYDEVGVKAQHSLVPKWIDLSSRWLVDVGINLDVCNMHYLVQAAFKLAVSSFPIEAMEMKFKQDIKAKVYQAELNRQENNIAILQNIRDIIKSISDNAKESVEKETNGMGLYFVAMNTLYAPNNVLIRDGMHDSSNLINYEESEDKISKSHMELYFWLRLEALLRVKLIFNRPRVKNTRNDGEVYDSNFGCFQSKTKYMENSYIDHIQTFVNELIDPTFIHYNNSFFDVFIGGKVKKGNYDKLEEKLTHSPFINDEAHLVDFDSFLYQLQKESPKIYEQLLSYEMAAATVAYSITDPFLFKGEGDRWFSETDNLISVFSNNPRWLLSSRPNDEDINNLVNFVRDIAVKEGSYYSATTFHSMIHNLKTDNCDSDDKVCRNALRCVFESYKDFGIVPAKAQFAHALQQKIRNIRGSK